MNPIIEEWRSIAICPRYEVSDRGRIRNAKTGKILKLGLQRHGYLCVAVSFSGNNRKYLKPAREVAQAFIGDRPKGYQINHKNGVKTDNRVENLEYVSPGDNLRHAVNHGLKRNNQHVFKKGEPKRKSKLSSDDVRFILLKRKETGFGAIRLAPLVGFSVSEVSTVIDKNKRKTVKAELGM